MSDKPLTATQLKHALSRVSEIHKKKREEIQNKHTIPGVELSLEQKFDLIFSENPPKLKDKNKLDLDRYTRLWDAFDFSEYEKEEIKDVISINKEIEELDKQTESIKDKLVFFNGPEVLNILEEWKVSGNINL